MRTLTTRAQLADWRRDVAGRVGLVPTMGSLHAGHLRLVEAARRDCDTVIASVFVNRLQFGPDEDFDNYPRDLATDAEQLERAGVTALFAPAEAEMFPRGVAATTIVEVPDLADILCGRHRPGHFRGVATIVAMLFNAVRPDTAYFGEKDYQQLAIVRRMASDLCAGVDVRGVAIEREIDGLARSSRNTYLDADERARAPALSAALAEVAVRLDDGDRDFAALCTLGWNRLVEAGFEPDYFDIRHPDLSAPAAASDGFRVLAAGRLGRARLIDNQAVDSG